MNYKPKKKEDGVITVFLAMIFMSVLLLTTVVVDGARIRFAQAETERALETATRAALAEYCIELKDDAGLFGVESADLSGKVNAYMTESLVPEATPVIKPVDIIQFEKDSIQVEASSAGNLANNPLFKQQILEYMKYRAPLGMVEELFDSLTDFEKASESLSIVDRINNLSESAQDIDKTVKELMELVEGIKVKGDEAEVMVDDVYVKLFSYEWDYNDYYETLIPDDSIKAQLHNDKASTVSDKQYKLSQDIKIEVDGEGDVEGSYNDTITVPKKYYQDSNLNKESSDDYASIEIVCNIANANEPVYYTYSNDAMAIHHLSDILDAYYYYKEKFDDTESEYEQTRKEIAAGIKEAQEKSSVQSAMSDMTLGIIEAPKYDLTKNQAQTIGAYYTYKEMKKACENRIDELCDQQVEVYSEVIGVNEEAKQLLDGDKGLISQLAAFNQEIAAIKQEINNNKESLYEPEALLKQVADIEKEILNEGSNTTKWTDMSQILGNNKTALSVMISQTQQIKDTYVGQEKEVCIQLTTFIDEQCRQYNDKIRIFHKPPTQDNTPDMRDKLDEVKQLQQLGSTFFARIESFGDWKKSIPEGCKIENLPSDGEGEDNYEVSFEKNNNLTSKTLDSDSGAGSYLSKIKKMTANAFVNLRNNAYMNEYIIGNFKTFTDYTVPSKGDITQANIATTGKDLQMNDYPDDTIIDYEAEYVLMGFTNEGVNVSLIATEIFVIRYAMNLLCFLTSPDFKLERSTLMSAAQAIAGWYTFGLGGTALYAIFVAAIIAIESMVDLIHLTGGERVPFLKSDSKDWTINGDKYVENACSQIAENGLADTVSNISKISESEDKGLSYDDYLRLFLLFTNEENKLNRMQDVIQLRRINDNANFMLSNYSTHINVKAEVGVKGLFLTGLLNMDDLFDDEEYSNKVFKITAETQMGY